MRQTLSKTSLQTNTVHSSKPQPKHRLNKLTQTRAAGGRDRGGECSRSVGQRLEVDPGCRCRQFYCRSPSGPHIVSHLWTEAWRRSSETEPGSDLDCPLHQGWGCSVSHCGQNVKHKPTPERPNSSSAFMFSLSCLILPFVKIYLQRVVYDEVRGTFRVNSSRVHTVLDHGVSHGCQVHHSRNTTVKGNTRTQKYSRR